MNSIFDMFGGRKSVLTLLILASGVAVDLLTERGLSSNLLTLLLGVLGLFVTGNVVSKKFIPQFGESSPPPIEVPPAASVDLSQIETSIKRIEERVNSVDEAGSQAMSQMAEGIANTLKMVKTLVELQISGRK